MAGDYDLDFVCTNIGQSLSHTTFHQGIVMVGLDLYDYFSERSVSVAACRRAATSAACSGVVPVAVT